MPFSVVATGMPVQLGQRHQLGRWLPRTAPLARQRSPAPCASASIRAVSATSPWDGLGEAASELSAAYQSTSPAGAVQHVVGEATSTGPSPTPRSAVQRPPEHVRPSSRVVQRCRQAGDRAIGRPRSGSSGPSPGRPRRARWDRAGSGCGRRRPGRSAPKAASAPGPYCVTHGRMRSPLVARANPSAMLTATRSVRVMIGRMPINEAESSSRFSGKPTMNSAPSRCSNSAIRSDTSVSVNWYTITPHTPR